jgi:hypothetical protein
VGPEMGGIVLFAEKFFRTEENIDNFCFNPDITNALNLYTNSRRQSPAGMCFTGPSPLVWYFSQVNVHLTTNAHFEIRRLDVENQNF